MSSRYKQFQVGGSAGSLWIYLRLVYCLAIMIFVKSVYAWKRAMEGVLPRCITNYEERAIQMIFQPLV